jgi:hypothetical protein
MTGNARPGTKRTTYPAHRMSARGGADIAPGYDVPFLPKADISVRAVIAWAMMAFVSEQ